MTQSEEVGGLQGGGADTEFDRGLTPIRGKNIST